MPSKERESAHYKPVDKLLKTVGICVAVLIVLFLAFYFVYLVPQNKYNDAVKMIDAGNYDQAIKAFEDMGDYQDAPSRIKQANASKLYDEGKLNEAYQLYSLLDPKYNQHSEDYEKLYNDAINSLDAGNFDQAEAAFQSISSYKDSKLRIKQVQANRLYASGQLAKAYEIYSAINPIYNQHEKDYEDLYNEATRLAGEGKLTEALDIYSSLGSYKDSKAKHIEVAVSLAKKYESEKDYAKARDVYLSVDMETEAAAAASNMEKEQKYQDARKLMDEQKYNEAASIFFEIADYEDSQVLAQESKFLEAQTLLNNEEYEQAIAAFESIKDYKDASARIIQAQASQIYSTGDIAKAYDLYSTIDEGYNQHIDEYQGLYEAAGQKQKDGMLQDAYNLYRSLGSYKDSIEKWKTVANLLIEQYQSERQYAQAASIYQDLGMNTAAQKSMEMQGLEDKYQQAMSFLESADYEQAIAIFETIIDYNDVTSRIIQAQANQIFDSGDITKAYRFYTTIDEGYNPHIDEYQNLYKSAEQKYKDGQLQEAYDLYQQLGLYKDSSEKQKIIGNLLTELYQNEKKFAQASKIYQDLGMEAEAHQASAKQRIEDNYQQAITLMNSADYDAAEAAFIALGDYEDSQALLIENTYRHGKAFMEQGLYIDAIDYFKLAGDYQDSQALITESKYQYANNLAANGDLLSSEEIYNELADYKDSASKLTEVRYQRADNLVQDSIYDEAIVIYTILGDQDKIRETEYKNAESLFAAGYVIDAYYKFKDLGEYQNANLKAKEIRQNSIQEMKRDMVFSYGNTIIFGRYEQDGNTDNGPEPLEWIVLGRTDRAVFVTTKYAIDCLRYQDPKENITWEYSQIRAWLNNVFYNKAFTPSERESIRNTAVSNTVGDGKYNTESGNNTFDCVYLLSYYEVSNYFKNDEERKLISTEVARRNGAHYPNCYWMTRSPGVARDQIMAVKNGGQTDYSTVVNDSHLGIRPAMWLLLGEVETQKAMFRKGSIVSFGSMFDRNNELKPVRWRVASKEDDAVTLVAEKAVYNEQFNTEKVNITWRDSSLRKILNGKFLDDAFNKKEKYSLLTMNVKLDSGDGVEGYRSAPTTEVEDKVTLLSYKQAQEIFGNKEQRRMHATDYAQSQGAGNGFVEYWLLSMGRNDQTMAIINGNGDPDSRSVTDKKGVLPMIKVSLSFGLD